MNLEEIVENLYQDSARTTPRGLALIAEAERYLQQAYEGRYFFELVQNVRDANKELEQDGDIRILLESGVLSISNTGAEFSQAGIEGITSIGKSTKQSQDYIGFKGIGFKSIREITDAPKIVTRYGTVVFDRKLTQTRLGEELPIDEIPLFFFPHYQPETLTSQELASGIITRIDLPLKERISEERVFSDFSLIQATQLILLDNIRVLEFRSGDRHVSFEIRKDARKHRVEVRKNDGEAHRFKVYSPANQIEIPTTIIDSLEGKEKDIFSKSPRVDATVVVEMNEHGQIAPIADAQLYLFYPLSFSSGFRFLVHSYFIVNPERTSLRMPSVFNSFLLKAIGSYIGTELLQTLRSARMNTTRILCFKRNPDSKLKELYDSTVASLKTEKFIYDPQEKRYYSIDEVIIADGFDRNLFPDGQLKGRHLIYLDDSEIRDWLQEEFDIEYLSFERIRDEIEAECARQAKKKSIGFFQNLYTYVSKHDGLNLIGKKVLLTDDWKLVSNEEDVFYGGGRRSIQLPKSLQHHIHFINKGITISDFRDGRSRTGIAEFNTYELVRRLLRLFEVEGVAKADILNAIYNLELDAKSETELREGVRLPVKNHGTGRMRWVSPIRNAIYFQSTKLIEHYPNGDFIEEEVIALDAESPTDIEQQRRREFFKKCGVWDKPAVYVPQTQTHISGSDPRASVIRRVSTLNEAPFLIRNDRKLDKPSVYTAWFKDTLIQNWDIYSTFVESTALPRPSFWNSWSAARNFAPNNYLEASDFIASLRTERWISFGDEGESFSVQELVGIEPSDYYQPHLQILRRYLKLFPISYAAKKKLINLTGLLHLGSDNILSLVSLMRAIRAKYEDLAEQGKEFVDFYNRGVLKKLFDFSVQFPLGDREIQILRNEHFLARNEATGELVWAKATDIYYIDDKPSYDLLPSEVKTQLQPQFTNRDKHTFGRLASKLGKRYSHSLRQELATSSVSRELPFTDFVPYLPECLAVFEASLEVVLMNQLETVRNARVLITDELKLRLTVGSSPPIEVESEYYVDEQSNLHVRSRALTNRNKVISMGIADMMVRFLERDVRKASADVYRFLNAPDKRAYLSDYEISPERIVEIRSQLTSTLLTHEQIFFNALLLAKGAVVDDSFLDGDGINVSAFAERFSGTTPDVFHQFRAHFDFDDYSNFRNIQPLSELLSRTGSALAELNQFLIPKISFDEILQETVLTTPQSQ